MKHRARKNPHQSHSLHLSRPSHNSPLRTPRATWSVAKSRRVYGQKRFPPCPKEVRLCPLGSFGVISMLFVRQFNAVLASIPSRNGVNIDGCPVRERKLATGKIRLATGGILPVQGGDRTLAGTDLNLPSIQKPSAPYGIGIYQLCL